MRIGIDVSQLAYQGGVPNILINLVQNLLKIDKKNEYVFFFSSMRKNFQSSIFNLESSPNVSIKEFRIPPTILDILWNKLHIIPIETFIGDIDIFITSDWTEPPVKRAKKATILYDLSIYKTPDEMVKKIIDVQKRKLKWVKKESSVIFCISKSTKKDAMELLDISTEKLKVIYPGA